MHSSENEIHVSIATAEGVLDAEAYAALGSEHGTRNPDRWNGTPSRKQQESVQRVQPVPLASAVHNTEPEALNLQSVTKASRQAAPDGRVLRWAEPRVDAGDLLYFLDANVWHRRCVQVKAMLVGGLGWQLLQDGEAIYDPSRSASVPDHPAAQLLARPNASAMQPLDVLIHRFLTDYFSLGNAYLEVVRDRSGHLAELYHVPARTMRRSARFDGYFQVQAAEAAAFRVFGEPDPAGLQSEILHLYQYDPQDDFYGMPDWYAALGAMGLDRTILEFNTYLFSNALMAHTAVVVEGGRLSTAARDAVKTFIQDRATGARNAGRILILEDERDEVKIRFEKLGLDMNDVVIVEAQRHFRDVVVAAHGVPPRILGIITPGQLGATGEVEGQLRTFVETVLRPGKRELETALNVLLEEVRPGCRIRFAEMDVTDLRSDAEFYSKMIQRGVYSPEEVRGLIDGAVQARVQG